MTTLDKIYKRYTYIMFELCALISIISFCLDVNDKDVIPLALLSLASYFISKSCQEN
jgi:hypothetical protein